MTPVKANHSLQIELVSPSTSVKVFVLMVRFIILCYVNKSH